jgi:hypothetical protein
MKKNIFRLSLVACYLLLVIPVRADYMLPYPSAMPGNKIYKVMRIIDKLKNYWYFGSIAQTKYHLGLADKYLVEAKTLLEYKQYLLAVDALVRSDNEFARVIDSIKRAKSEAKSISVLQKNVSDAADKHAEVLSAVLPIVPSQFTWTPEKQASTDLKLKDMITSSINLRKNVSDQALSL